MMPENFIFEVRRLMLDKRYDKALAHCYQNKTPTANLIAKGMESRKRGYQNVVDAIQNEGQRRQKSLGDKVQLLRKISLAAPFIGILGAFAALYFSYTNTIEAGSFLSFFLVGITPAIIGLVVSIISWVFYVTLQKRIYFLMNTIINEVLTLVRTVDIDYR